MVRYDEVIGDLRIAYDRGAAWREARGKQSWKLAERQSFLDRLRAEGTLPEDNHEPKGFFAFRTDEQLVEHASREFEVLDFHIVNTAAAVRHC